jgi:hypothetical protein
MKTKTFLLLLVSIALFACKKDNGEDPIPSPNDVVPDPEGTVLISVMNRSNGNNDFKGIRITDAGNFYGSDWTFSGLGNMMGLGNIVTIPQSGYVAEYSARAGYGYVGKQSITNGYNSYECNFIRFWVEYTSETGAEIRYQYPFKGLSKELQLISNEIILENGSSAQGTVELKEMAPFKASVTSEWLRLSHSENGAFAVTARSENQNVSAREATVTVTGSNSETKTVKVIQQGAAPFMSIPENQKNISAASTASNGTIALTANTDWSVSSDVSWCTVAPSSGNGSAGVTYSIQQNNSGSERFASITFSAQGLESIKVTVTQDPPFMSIPEDQKNISANGTASNGTISLTADASWSVSSDASWCTVSPLSGNGNANVTYSIQQNNSGEKRIANITFSAQGIKSIKVTVTQNPFFSEGSGILGNPYIVTNAEQLALVSQYSSSYFRMTKDIDLTEYLKNSATGWTPFAFRGDFDGNGHTVSGLWIDRPSDQDAGLFSELRGKIGNLTLNISSKGIAGKNTGGIAAGVVGGTITNCSVNGTITGSDNTGGIAGWTSDGINTYSNITNCSVTGTITGGNGGNTGGIAGAASGTITNCSVNGTITGINSKYTGGIAGSLSYTSITKCKYNGTLSGINVGGIAGYANSHNYTLNYSYSQGNISGTIVAGGLIGVVTNYYTLSDSYSTAKVSVNGFNYACYAGGIVGKKEGNSSVTVSRCYYAGILSVSFSAGGSERKVGIAGEGSITSSFYDSSIAGTNIVDSSNGRTTAQMKQKSTYSQWDFNTVWNISEGTSYPTLRE